MPTITNIAAYKFAPLADLKPLRDRLIEHCKNNGPSEGSDHQTPDGGQF